MENVLENENMKHYDENGKFLFESEPSESVQKLLDAAKNLGKPNTVAPCRHFLTGIFNNATGKCPYCEIDLLERQVRDTQVTAIAEATEVDRLREELAGKFNEGIDSCIARLYEMDRITSGRHNFYRHAAIELAKLKDAP